MKTITVEASKKYDVIVGQGLLDMAGEYIRSVVPKAARAAVISDDNVAPLYLERVIRSLENAGFEAVSFVFPHGESSKNGETYLQILNFMAAGQITRSDVAIALGGGVVGDITGFAAATFLRGISYVQLPTSLLAMVDSSVGGKTAIDLKEGKNLAGAFCQPELVLCDLEVLDTLTSEFFIDGSAEVIKYGVLEDPELFAHLMEKGLNFEREYVISRCIEIKRDYVCEDEFDTGVRRKLNLGHTVGHAIEKCSAYKISHGRAVAIGLAIVARACVEKGLCTAKCRDDIIEGLKALCLPTETDFDSAQLLQPMLSDKKRTGGTVSLIIPKNVGDCPIYPIPVEELEAFVKSGL